MILLKQNAPVFYFFILDRNAGYLQDTVLQQCCTTDCSCLDMPFSPSSRYCFDTEIPSSAHSFCDSLHSTQHSFSCMGSWKSTPFNSNKNNRPVRSNSCKDAPQTKRLRLLMGSSWKEQKTSNNSSVVHLLSSYSVFIIPLLLRNVSYFSVKSMKNDL